MQLLCLNQVVEVTSNVFEQKVGSSYQCIQSGCGKQLSTSAIRLWEAASWVFIYLGCALYVMFCVPAFSTTDFLDAVCPAGTPDMPIFSTPKKEDLRRWGSSTGSGTPVSKIKCAMNFHILTFRYLYTDVPSTSKFCLLAMHWCVINIQPLPSYDALLCDQHPNSALLRCIEMRSTSKLCLLAMHRNAIYIQTPLSWRCRYIHVG